MRKLLLVITCGLLIQPCHADDIYQISTCLWTGQFHSIGRIGNYIYGGANGSYIFSLDNPISPNMVKHLPYGMNGRMSLNGNFLYIDGPVFMVYDISDTLNPIRASFYNAGPSRGVSDVFILGNYAYLVTESEFDLYSYFRIIDLSDPYNLIQLSNLALPQYAYGLFVRDTIAYISISSMGSSWLYTVDVSNIESTRVISSVQFPDYSMAHDIFVSGSFAYVASSNLSVVYIANPNNPYYLSSLQLGDCYFIYDRGDTLFLSGTGGIYFVDISDPDVPSLIHEYTYSSRIADFCFRDDTLYFVTPAVTQGPYEMGILDISNLTQPQLIGGYQMPDRTNDVVATANHAYVANSNSGVRVIDISDPANPVVGDNSHTGVGSKIVQLIGNYIFSAHNYGAEIFDISNPDTFQLVSNIAVSNFINDMYVDAGRVYFATNDTNILIYDIHDIANPILAGNYNNFQFLYSIAAQGNYMYATNLYSTDIIDVTDPSSPQLVSSVPSDYHPRDAKAFGNYLYTTGNYNQVQIVDISDPSNPILIANYPESTFFTKLAICGEYIYLSESSIMEVVNVSDPHNPFRAGIYPMSSGPVFATDDLIFIAGYDHLEIARMVEVGISESFATGNINFAIANYPNPFNSQTKIPYTIPKTSLVTLDIFDILGKKVTRLSEGIRQPGDYEFTWDASGLSSGIYFYKLTAGEYHQTSKMVLLK